MTDAPDIFVEPVYAVFTDQALDSLGAILLADELNEENSTSKNDLPAATAQPPRKVV
jgi:hypothetical protein